jgi:Fe-S-cluster containining protein
MEVVARQNRLRRGGVRRPWRFQGEDDNEGSPHFNHNPSGRAAEGEQALGTSVAIIWSMLDRNPASADRLDLFMLRPAGDQELVQIVDAAFADAARRAGKRLVCRPGCTQCCTGVFAINALDAARLKEGMDRLRAENPAVAGQVEFRTFDWMALWGEDFPGDPMTGVLGEVKEDTALFEVWANDAVCPALDPATGLCDLYEWRPMTCRVFGPPVRQGEEGALGHCELCFEGATPEEVVVCEMTVPHDLEDALCQEPERTIVAFALMR